MSFPCKHYANEICKYDSVLDLKDNKHAPDAENKSRKCIKYSCTPNE